MTKKKADLEQRLTSLATTTKGFTLVEIMVVVAIIAAVVAILIPRIDNKNNKMKAAVRRFSALTRELHTRAKLKGTTYRLAIDLKDGSETQTTQQYWVERSNATVILSEKDEKAFKDDLKNLRQDEKKPKDLYGFELDSTIIKGVQEIKVPLRIISVEKKGYKDIFNSGLAYIYFFPQGLSEEAIIQLKAGENLQWSLAVQPLTGKSDVVSRLITLKDLIQQ